MATNHILETRKGIVGAMRANPALIALCPRVYGEEAPANPVWPFILCGLPTETPDRASCWDGTEMGIVVHCFARGPGMDAASAIANQVKRTLDGIHIDRGELGIDIQHEQTQVVRDGVEVSDYHGIVRLTANAVEWMDGMATD